MFHVPLGPVAPANLVAKRLSPDDVPRVRRDEENFFRRKAQNLRRQRVDSGRWLVRPNSVNGNDFGKTGRQTVVLNSGCKHLGRTVGKDGQWGTPPRRASKASGTSGNAAVPEESPHESVKF